MASIEEDSPSSAVPSCGRGLMVRDIRIEGDLRRNPGVRGRGGCTSHIGSGWGEPRLQRRCRAGPGPLESPKPPSSRQVERPHPPALWSGCGRYRERAFSCHRITNENGKRGEPGESRRGPARAGHTFDPRPARRREILGGPAVPGRSIFRVPRAPAAPPGYRARGVPAQSPGRFGRVRPASENR